MPRIILSNDPLLKSQAFQEVIARLPPSAFPASWESKHLEQLPLFPTVLECIRLATEVFLSLLAKDGLESASAPIIVVPVYTLADGSSVRTIRLDAAGVAPCLDLTIVLFDLRLVYEALTIVAVSPMGGRTSQPEMSVSYAKLALATRLGAESDDRLQRIALGLTATAVMELTDPGHGKEWAFTLAKLLQESHLSNDEVTAVISVLVSRILFHEFAHVLFERSSAAATAYRSFITDAFNALASDIPHLLHHDRINNDLAASVGAGGALESPAILEEFFDAQSPANIFGDTDIEEIMCDYYALVNSLRILELKGLLSTSAAGLVGHTIDLLDIWASNVIFSIPVYKGVSQIVGQFELEVSGQDRESYIAATAEMLKNGTQKRSLILSVRRFFNDKLFNSLVCTIAAEDRADSRLPELDWPAVLDDPSHDEWREFAMKFHHLLHTTAVELSAVVRLSSIGRGISLFASYGLPAPDSQLRTDPFSFYAFGFLPTGGEHQRPDNK